MRLFIRFHHGYRSEVGDEFRAQGPEGTGAGERASEDRIVRTRRRAKRLSSSISDPDKWQ